jgi:hypothetical protein
MEHEQLQREAALQAVSELPRYQVLSLGMLAAIGTVMGGGTAAEQVGRCCEVLYLGMHAHQQCMGAALVLWVQGDCKGEV